MKMTKLDFSFFIAFVLSFLFVLFLCIVTLSKPSDEYIVVEIKDGDTVWGLAQIYEDEHKLSAQQFVEWVILKNNIDKDYIYPGQELVIPVKRSEQLTAFR